MKLNQNKFKIKSNQIRNQIKSNQMKFETLNAKNQIQKRIRIK